MLLPSCQDKNGGGLGQSLVRSCLSLFLHGLGPCLWFAWGCLVLFPSSQDKNVGDLGQGLGRSCRSSFLRVGFLLVFGVIGWLSRVAWMCSDKNGW